MSNTNTPILDSLQTETLTASQWARRLDVSPSTISRWALCGELEHVRVGKQIRATPEAMEACLRERTEARQRRHRERNAGSKARSAAHSAEVEAELNKI